MAIFSIHDAKAASEFLPADPKPIFGKIKEMV
jgi:hypothetical protein